MSTSLLSRIPGLYRGTILLARLYRPALRGVVFIGVTGSAGKTTTKELIAAVLARRLRGQRSPGTLNDIGEVAKNVLATRPWHAFCVQEMAAGHSGPGSLRRRLGFVRPRIAVVTAVGGDHLKAFGSLEAIAAEKGELVAAVPPDGVAILNADDPRVLAMGARCAGRVVTYGLAERATLRAEDVEATWPERLSFTARYEGQTVRVRTQLCGALWVPSALAALATGVNMGVPLAEGAEALAGFPPVSGRMQPLHRRDGVDVISDYWKASLWTIAPSLAYLRAARAARRIVVLGTLSDYSGDSGRRYLAVARDALAAADHVVFVGPRASSALRAKRGPADDALRAFGTVDAAVDHLRGFVRPGDLVLVKGSQHADHLKGLVDRLMEDPGATASHGMLEAPTAPDPGATARPSAGTGSVFAVVGIGNRGPQFEGTPHNIGWRVLDDVAHELDARWAAEEGAAVARATWPGATVYLIKPSTNVNMTGATLAAVSRRDGLTPERCILLHDDVNLPLGTVRERRRGSDGGHRGVRSALLAFGTDAIPRVKVGVGRPTDGSSLPEYVLTPFPAAQASLVDGACAQAVDYVLNLLRQLTATAPAPSP